MNKATKTRNFIIEQVAPLFNRQGYSGTSISDITSATGLTKGSIYGNFRNKDEVALEAFRYNLADLTTQVNFEIARTERANEKLLVFIRYNRNHYARIFARGGCAILNAAVDSDDGNQAILSEVRQALNRWKNVLVTIVEQGRQCGELTIPDAGKFACLFISLVEGSIMLSKTTANPECLMQNLDFLQEYIKSHTVR